MLNFTTRQRTIHESYGILHEDRDRLLNEFHKLLDLLRAVKDGSVNPAQIVVSADSWDLLPVSEVVKPEPEEGG